MPPFVLDSRFDYGMLTLPLTRPLCGISSTEPSFVHMESHELPDPDGDV
jgi:hypothetical protein